MPRKRLREAEESEEEDSPEEEDAESEDVEESAPAAADIEDEDEDSEPQWLQQKFTGERRGKVIRGLTLQEQRKYIGKACAHSWGWKSLNVSQGALTFSFVCLTLCPSV